MYAKCPKKYKLPEEFYECFSKFFTHASYDFENEEKCVNNFRTFPGMIVSVCKLNTFYIFILFIFIQLMILSVQSSQRSI